MSCTGRPASRCKFSAENYTCILKYTFHFGLINKMSKKDIIIVLILIIIALIRFFYFLPVPPDWSSALGERVEVTGEIIEPPDVRAYNNRVTLRPVGQETNILVIAPSDVEVSYGDLVTVSGTLSTPENFITNIGKEFNYERYLANKDIYYTIEKAEIKVIANNQGSYIKSQLYKLRGYFLKNITKVIAPPGSDLAGGLILGARRGFDEDIQSELITTGTIHIVALSGYNVTIVAEGVMKLFGTIFSEIVSITLGVIVIILFVIMSGASTTAIRAGIMASIILFARMTGRTYQAGRTLVIALLLMMAHDLRVLSDISFQLSFLATAGVLFLTPKFIPHLKLFPIRFKIRELVATTIAATTAVLPLILYHMGVLSIVSVPANLLILPAIPLTMFFSFLAGIFGFISPILSYPVGYLANLLLSYILFVIHFFAELPYASLNIRTFPLILTILLYLILLWWVTRQTI